MLVQDRQKFFEPEPPPRLRRFGCFALFSYWRSHPSWPGGAIGTALLEHRGAVAFRHLADGDLANLLHCRGLDNGYAVRSRAGDVGRLAVW